MLNILNPIYKICSIINTTRVICLNIALIYFVYMFIKTNLKFENKE